MLNINYKLILVTFIFINTLAYSQFRTLSEKVNYYKDKFKVSCANEKITDNRGNGYDDLYGTRNMRTILYGVAYRGGANNHYHKTNQRHNHNPLPEDGLVHLLENGFSMANYLYGTNFKDSKKLYKSENGKDSLIYTQNSGNSRAQIRNIFEQIIEIIDKPELGPIYLHCWNGWHQSGYVSSAILMQFCDLSNEDAFQYWMDNTDGVNKGYDNVKSMVRNFQRFDDIKIDEKVKKEICPCIKNK